MNKAAQALGRLAAGKPKNYSAAEIERRSKILAGINARKRAKAKKRSKTKARRFQGKRGQRILVLPLLPDPRPKGRISDEDWMK